ncbi:MAG TPA: PAS domain-containing protein, partial [Candidatus Binatia bacterium]|nr:PAS domain-containing protein [Candidatus Binatia bacterium]
MRPILEARPQQVALRTWALLYLTGGIASLLGGAVAAASGLRPGPAVVIGLVALTVAAVCRYRPSVVSRGGRIAALPVLAIVLIALTGEAYGFGVGFAAGGMALGSGTVDAVAAGLGVGAAALYVVVFALIGATNPRGRSLAFSLVLGGAILAPLAVDGRLTTLALMAGVVVVALCIAVAEGMGWLRDADLEAQIGSDEDDTDAVVRAVLATATDASVVVDRSGVIAFANASVTDTLHRDPEDLVGRDIGTIVTPASAAAIREAHRSLALGASRTLDCEIVRDTGDRLAVQIVATRLATDRGLVLTVQDATRWKALEEELTRQAFSD